MKKRFIAVFTIFLCALNATGEEKKLQKKLEKGCGNSNIDFYESIRGSPNDTMKNSVEIDSNLNCVQVNGKTLKISADSVYKTIYVDELGNSISIEQKDHSSKVIVSQKGKSNKISIIQK